MWHLFLLLLESCHFDFWVLKINADVLIVLIYLFWRNCESTIWASLVLDLGFLADELSWFSPIFSGHDNVQEMGVISRKLFPACESMCVCCPALRSRSRQPVKRYKKLLAEIFPKSVSIKLFIFSSSFPLIGIYVLIIFWGFSIKYIRPIVKFHFYNLSSSYCNFCLARVMSRLCVMVSRG